MLIEKWSWKSCLSTSCDRPVPQTDALFQHKLAQRRSDTTWPFDLLITFLDPFHYPRSRLVSWISRTSLTRAADHESKDRLGDKDTLEETWRELSASASAASMSVPNVCGLLQQEVHPSKLLRPRECLVYHWSEPTRWKNAQTLLYLLTLTAPHVRRLRTRWLIRCVWQDVRSRKYPRGIQQCENWRLYCMRMHAVLHSVLHSLKMSFIQMGPVIFGPVEGIISFMRAKHLLASHMTCSR